MFERQHRPLSRFQGEGEYAPDHHGDHRRRIRRLPAAASAQVLAADSYVVGTDAAAGEYHRRPAQTSAGRPRDLGFVTGRLQRGHRHRAVSCLPTSGLSYAAARRRRCRQRQGHLRAAPIDGFTRSVARNLARHAPRRRAPSTSATSSTGGNFAPTGDTDGYALTGFGNFVAPTFGATSGFLDGVFVGLAQKSTDRRGQPRPSLRTHRGGSRPRTSSSSTATPSTPQAMTYNVVYKADGQRRLARRRLLGRTRPTSRDDASLDRSSAATGVFNSFAFGDADLDRLNYDAVLWNGNVVLRRADDCGLRRAVWSFRSPRPPRWPARRGRPGDASPPSPRIPHPPVVGRLIAAGHLS